MKPSSCGVSSAAFVERSVTTTTKMKTEALVPLPTTRCIALRRRGRGLTPGITLQSARVLGAFERSRVRAASLAHDAFDLLNRFVFMVLPPFAHFALKDPNVINPFLQQHRAQHRNVGARHYHFQRIYAMMDPARGGQICAD